MSVAVLVVDHFDRRLSVGGLLGERQLEDATIDRRRRVGGDCVVGNRQRDVEKERPVLLEILVVAREVLLSLGVDVERAVLDGEVDRVGGNPRHVDDEQVGLVALEQVEEDVTGEIPQRVAER